MMKRNITAGLISVSMAFGFAAPVFAQEIAEPATAQPATSPTGAWSFSGTIYGWIASISQKTTSGDNIDVSFSDILDTLDMTIMGGVAAHKDRWTIFSDLIYLNIGDTQRTTANIIGNPAKVKADVDVKSYINTTGVGYQLYDSGTTTISGLAGVRYLKLDATLDLDVGPRSRRVKQKGTNWDGIVGFRGKTELSDDWYLTYYADIGTGDSDLTYQLFAGANYRFKKWDAVIGYRYMDWDLGSGGALKDMNVSGPLIGARFRF